MATKFSIPPNADVLAAAFDKIQPHFGELPAEFLLTRLNFDVTATVSIMLGAQSALEDLRGELLALPNMKPEFIGDLHLIAYAALFAHMRTLAAIDEPNLLPKLTDEARLARRKLHGDAVSAINHAVLPENALEEVPMGNGRLEIAQGILALGIILRSALPQLEGKSAVTKQLLDTSVNLGVRLLAEVGRGENTATSTPNDSRDQERLLAVSYLAWVYDECRRAVSFVRWRADDANDFAPPFSGPRGPRAKPADEPPPAPPDGGNNGPAKPNP